MILSPQNDHAAEHAVSITHNFVKLFVGSFVIGAQIKQSQAHETHGGQRIRQAKSGLPLITIPQEPQLPAQRCDRKNTPELSKMTGIFSAILILDTECFSKDCLGSFSELFSIFILNSEEEIKKVMGATGWRREFLAIVLMSPYIFMHGYPSMPEKHRYLLISSTFVTKAAYRESMAIDAPKKTDEKANHIGELLF